DCDGEGVGGVDEGFDKLNDPRFCGPTCTRCDLPNAIEGCLNGECVVRACLRGWADRDPLQPGCETACPSLTPEVCDGVDNDCDGLVDAADPNLIAPPNFCIVSGACEGTVPVCGPAGPAASGCDQTVRWRCVYQAPAEVDACGNLVADERLCDGVDGDCDGMADDSYPMAGTPCAEEGAHGVCQGTGTFVCSDNHDDVRCQITTPGISPAVEVCDNLDNDCDGDIDNGATDTVVHVQGGGLDFYIYAYEASRPDATAGSVGSAGHRACTKPGTQPWRNVSWAEADAACRAAGRRLCTEAEWQQACQGDANNIYPYGATYLADACNGKDYSPGCVSPDLDAAQVSGRPYGCPNGAPCQTPSGIYDLSGNLKEWTGTQVSSSPVRYRVRGGSYDSIADGLTCRFDFVAAEASYRYGNLGFRCCSDQP
ncbi:MAG: SUMF1/EgtB/PvdO family nonheme iron enzyme, partial [Deltaproteobacteria bacterium]|nr:SUMF1/EgtB/PvdO family nonheme iron enzyme [Deltaproteobacteria bacterium]